MFPLHLPNSLAARSVLLPTTLLWALAACSGTDATGVTATADAQGADSSVFAVDSLADVGAGVKDVATTDGPLVDSAADDAASVIDRDAEVDFGPVDSGSTPPPEDIVSPVDLGPEDLGTVDTQVPDVPPPDIVAPDVPVADDVPPPVDVVDPPEAACPSGIYWILGNIGTAFMHPGLACMACHAKKGPSFFAAGTVYSGKHTVDDCSGTNGVTVELTGADGQVVSASTNLSGNFYFKGSVATPYTAVVKSGGKSRNMLGPQVSGDCNTCHTKAGDNGAPGRIQAP